ncbi:MAG TPA: peptide-methionine (S)-S-oxide reductase MsrA [Kiritimatiellia bacterium]|nr:peptide-methionine (S)-S-oxide reductase MsrA [Kiritimatiellia bacterium]
MKGSFLALSLLAAAPALAQSGGPMSAAPTTELATFAGGCFWCIEEIFRQQPGVVKVTSGYTGGTVKDPTYAQVCAGDTGHAEALRIEFDPQKTSYENLLAVFWKAHDPTQLNRQGADVGTQYRSAIFTHSDAQAAAARAALEAENRSGHFARPLVTEIVPAGPFYPAEDYHQLYYQNNKNAPYCRFVIRPKLEKMGLDD